MKVLITGATGFLGRHVAREALAAGHTVRALVRSQSQELPEGVEPMLGSLFEPDRLAAAVHGQDAVVHLAGLVSRDPADASAMYEVHVEGTRRLLSAMGTAGVRRLVLASTSGTIGLRRDRPRQPATESSVPDFELLGRFPYYTSKLYQEREVLRRSGEIDAVILNPSLLLGPGDERVSSTGDVLDVLHRRVPALAGGSVALVDVRDAAPAFARALDAGQPGERYLLNGANMAVRVFAQRVAVAGDVAAPTFQVPAQWAVRGARIMDGLFSALHRDPPIDPVTVELSTLFWDVDASKAARELGFVARDPQATIEATVRDLEARGRYRRPR